MKIYVSLKGKSVKIILSKKNMTQNEFARQINVSQYYLSELLSEQKNPSPHLRKKIQKFLRIRDWDKLFQVKSENEDV